MKLLFSIVSHNQGDLIEKLINSFDKFLQCSDHQVEIIITKNAGDPIKSKSKYFQTTIVNNLREKGFGSNHNTVFENFTSDFFFIVNPDIYLTCCFNLDHFISEMISKNIDISSPKILNPQGLTDDYKRSDLKFKNLIKRKILKRKDEKFEWLAGMFLVVKSVSYRELCGFDNKYFMYVEDCDLSMRGRRLNMKIDDIRMFSVVHDARRASKKQFKHLKWHFKSLMRYWFLT